MHASIAGTHQYTAEAGTPKPGASLAPVVLLRFYNGDATYQLGRTV